MYANLYYSITQQVILVVVSLISGLSSFIGSVLIISIIWRDGHEKLNFVYHRILFAVSIIDCISSIAFAFSFLAVPKGIFWGAVGNTTSCEATGFLTFLLGSQLLYNFGLAVYFLLIIYYGKSQRFIASHIEPFIHTLSIILPLGFATWSLVTDSLNPLLFEGGWCYVYPYPPACSDLEKIECTRGLMALVIRLLAGIFLGAVPLVGILICMIMIVYRVRKTFATSLRNRMQERLNERTKQTAIQSILYVAATLIPITLVFITQNIKNNQKSLRFILGILVKVMIPIQGVFNFFIYIRPRLLSMRERDGGSTSFKVLIWRIAFAGKSRDDPDAESDFAPELSRSYANSQIELNGHIEACHENH
jgi:hypothetical protein